MKEHLRKVEDGETRNLYMSKNIRNKLIALMSNMIKMINNFYS